MKKGFIYSIDSLYGIIAVIIIFGLMTFYYQGGSSYDNFSKKIKTSVYDGAIVGFDLNKTAGNFDLNTYAQLPNPRPEFYECTFHRKFVIKKDSNVTFQSGFDQNKYFCEWVEWNED